MQFGITIKPDISVERIVGLTRQAESAGFTFGWIFDSHVLWMEPYPLLTLMAMNTKRMQPGYVRDESRHTGFDCDRQPVRNPQSDIGRADGTRASAAATVRGA